MKYTSSFLLAFVWLTGIHQAQAQTPRINFTAPMVYPEGVAFNAKTNQYFVSSVKTATIGTVDPAGKYSPFYEDSALKSSYGMKIDPKTNRLWVCTSDGNYSKFSEPGTYKKVARLISIDLATKKKVDDIDLAKLYPGKHFINDLVFDDKGNIYITDSYSPVIYKVDAKGSASVFAESDFFKGEDVGLNGIVFHPKGFLLVANDREGALYKVDINNPKAISKVKIKNLFPGIDGLLWDAQNNLVLIQNKGVDKTYQLTSKDNWLSADILASTLITDRFQYPTTGVLQSGKIYVLNAKLNEITDSTRAPSKEFSLQQVEFRPVQ